jgi:hypothetical protein
MMQKRERYLEQIKQPNTHTTTYNYNNNPPTHPHTPFGHFLPWWRLGLLQRIHSIGKDQALEAYLEPGIIVFNAYTNTTTNAKKKKKKNVDIQIHILLFVKQ